MPVQLPTKNRVRELMLEQGLTFQAAADAIGISKSTLQKIAANQDVQLSVIVKCCNFFGLRLGDLLDYDPHTP